MKALTLQRVACTACCPRMAMRTSGDIVTSVISKTANQDVKNSRIVFMCAYANDTVYAMCILAVSSNTTG